MKLITRLVALTFMFFLIAAKSEAECFFKENTTVVCVTDGGETNCTTTDYWDLICAGGGTAGGGGGGTSSGTNLSPSQQQAVQQAVTLARERLLGEPACAGMYSELGLGQTDGQAILTNTIYVNGSSTSTCQQKPNGMWTFVNSNVVRVCGGVPNLRSIDNAMLLLHESLHTAGQLEAPGTPGAPSSPDISGFVRVRCNLH